MRSMTRGWPSTSAFIAVWRASIESRGDIWFELLFLLHFWRVKETETFPNGP